MSELFDLGWATARVDTDTDGDPYVTFVTPHDPASNLPPQEITLFCHALDALEGVVIAMRQLLDTNSAGALPEPSEHAFAGPMPDAGPQDESISHFESLEESYSPNNPSQWTALTDERQAFSLNTSHKPLDDFSDL